MFVFHAASNCLKRICCLSSFIYCILTKEKERVRKRNWNLFKTDINAKMSLKDKIKCYLTDINNDYDRYFVTLLGGPESLISFVWFTRQFFFFFFKDTSFIWLKKLISCFHFRSSINLFNLI